jgi:hypothetical protein
MISSDAAVAGSVVREHFSPPRRVTLKTKKAKPVSRNEMTLKSTRGAGARLALNSK